MSQECPMLSELTNGSHWVTINVRVSRMWDSINRAKEVFSLNLQLLDIKGNQKHAVVPKGLLDKYENTFDEQCVYEIENFNVVQSERCYRVIDEELMILLRKDTRVKRLDNILNDIPTHKFGFVSDEVLATRIEKCNQLTDIAGVLTRISEVVPITTRTGCQTAKRELILQNDSGKNLPITLWAEKTNLVDVSTAQSTKTLPLVVLTSLTVKLYKGEINFSSTYASKYYAEVNDPAIKKMVKRSSKVVNAHVQTIEHPKKPELTQEMTTVRADIATIQSDIRNEICLDKRYIVPVTIMQINTANGWSYLSCPICRKTVTKGDNDFMCPKCQTAVQHPLQRYRLTIEVFDHTTTATVIVFDKDATNLLHRTVDDMIHLKNLVNGEPMVEKLFNKLIGAETEMEFRLTRYDIDNRGKTLSVSKIGKVIFPYSHCKQESLVENNTLYEVDDNNCSQVTTEAIILDSTTKLKGKMKVEQDDDSPNNYEEGVQYSDKGSNRAKGIVITDIDETEVQKRKKPGKKTDMKRRKKI